MSFFKKQRKRKESKAINKEKHKSMRNDIITKSFLNYIII